MPAIPFKVKAVYEYKSAEPDDLTFPNGQIITVTDDAEEDWYTGEYVSASGEKIEGIFPRNFVEKYEPAVPSRPARAPKRAPLSEPDPEPPAAQEQTKVEEPPEPIAEPEPEISKPAPQPALLAEEATSTKVAEPPQRATEPKSPPARSGPPPVAEKPASNSFKDRIAAFNKPAAAPVAPFKPASSGSAGFIKKPFVAPPPSKNAYVPPPRELPPQKIYHREEETSEELPSAERDVQPPSIRPEESADDDQPKPTSLKDRIALLQKQQLEQAQRQADAAHKKEKPKKPPKKRAEPVEDVEPSQAEPGLERLDTNETVGKKSSDLANEADGGRPPIQRQESAQSGPPPLQPSRELVSDTNDADDSGAGDTEDAQDMSTEEERPRSKGTGAANLAESKNPIAEHKEEEDEDEEDEEDTEEDEDPEIRRKRELRERMAKMSGGMGMMGMFGPPGGAAPPPRKSRPSQEHSREVEQHAQEEAARAPPVPIMALPGMSTQQQKRTTEPEELDSEEDDETAQPTPQEPTPHAGVDNDYVSQPPPPPRRSDTMKSSASMDRPPPPPPPQREDPGLQSQQESIPVPSTPSTSRRAVPPPPPVTTTDLINDTGNVTSPKSPRARRSVEQPSSPPGAPPVPSGRSRPDTARKQSGDPSLTSPLQSPQTRAPPPPPPGQPPSRRSTADVSSPRQFSDDSDEEVTEYDGDYDTDIASSAKHKDALKSHQRDSSFDDGVLTDDAAKSPKSPPHRVVPPLPPLPAQHNAPPPPPPQAPVARKSMDASRAPPPIPPPAMPQAEDDDEYDPYRYNSPSTTGLPTPQLNDIYKTLSAGEEQEEDDMYGGASQPPRMPPPPPSDRAAPPPPPMDRSLPPPPAERVAPPPPVNRAPPPMPPGSPPSDVPVPGQRPGEPRRSNTLPRRSMEQPRASGEGFIAQDIDLAHSSFWWTQANLPPPALANRPDVQYEIDENTSTKRGGRATVSKDVYVLYSDYSQSTINATFDKADPSQVTLEQKHERPPPTPRKDQLEAASERYGGPIATAASNFGSQGATVADGSAYGFVFELLRSNPNALRPVGIRAFGAVVYANLANASTQQFDEIRPGDIVTFRNTKFAGHKGTMHAKYTQEVGKPDHAGVVVEWDGTKKKLRVWEQRSDEDRKEKKRAKVRDESYRLGDLKSGEVRVWRIMGRDYVGWDKS